MNFSSILDISSFFIGIIINLLFVALMCYYFKSKYDHLELAQHEQAKILYDLIQKDRRNSMLNMCPLEIKPTVVEMSDDSDSDDSESDDETTSTASTSDIEDLDNLISEIKEEDIKHLSIQETTAEVPEEISFIVTKVDEKTDEKVEEKNDEYGKMTMKQLKELLSNKGIKTKPNMRKEELIELINRKDLPVSGSPTFGAFSSENIEIEGMEELSA
jgi:hypothetical protein